MRLYRARVSRSYGPKVSWPNVLMISGTRFHRDASYLKLMSVERRPPNVLSCSQLSQVKILPQVFSRVFSESFQKTLLQNSHKPPGHNTERI